jgi:peptidoglycan L-alanyl-D-glutamate endopeptidase CwlK
VILEYDNTIVDGYRGKKEQNEAFERGDSQVKYPNSKHNSIPSEAVDSAPYEVNGIDWKRTQCAHYAGYVKGVADRLYTEGLMKHRIRCGIDWDQDLDIDDTTFWDATHFEIIKV